MDQVQKTAAVAKVAGSCGLLTQHSVLAGVYACRDDNSAADSHQLTMTSVTVAARRHIPGYPRVDRDNSFLVSRFDGCILDGKAWGPGLEGPAAAGPDAARSAAERALRHLEVHGGPLPDSTLGASDGGGTEALVSCCTRYLCPRELCHLSSCGIMLSNSLPARAAYCRAATRGHWRTMPTTLGRGSSPT